MFRNYTDQKFHDCYRGVWYDFWTIYGEFYFFLTTSGKYITSRLNLWKGPKLNSRPSKKFLIVDHPKEGHNDQDFKRYIIYGILDLLKNPLR